jgi:hypothetical protein
VEKPWFQPWFRESDLPSGKLTWLIMEKIFSIGKSWYINYKWSFSIAILVYQRLHSWLDCPHLWYVSSPQPVAFEVAWLRTDW